MKRTPERTSIGEMDIDRDTSTQFFQQQNDEKFVMYKEKMKEGVI